jgi:ornithine decarboxylase
MVMTASVIERYAHDVDINNIYYKKSQLNADVLTTSNNATNHGVSISNNNKNLGIAKRLIGEAFRRRVEGIDNDACQPGDEDTFYVADLGEVYRQHMRWKQRLPRVKPFFAVKSNPDPQVMRLLAELGAGFDCASKAEIEQVLSMGLNPDRIIYAQPCKTNSYVRFVKSVGVKRMTFDNADELHKVAKLFPGAELLLRIMTDDTSSQCRLSMKFGAAPETTDSLLATAQELGLNIVGVSFHVGSGASDPLAFYKAVHDASVVFEQAHARGFKMQVLDVGGGFCSETFDDMSAILSRALDEYFPAHSGISLIAEPGRFYVSTAFSIACNVIARRTVEDPSGLGGAKGHMVYVNDGVYGNFSCIMFDHYTPEPRILRAGGRFMYDRPESRPAPTGEGVEHSIWGPTCDGIDRISASTYFDTEVDVGDWLYFENMGAYTKCSATRFNGFPDSHDAIYVCSEPGARALLDM